MTYTTGFYDAIASGCASSASVVVPLLLQQWPARSVVDVGCGQGWWGAEFTQYGCQVTGIDGSYVEDVQLSSFIEHDLMTTLPPLHADMAVCLEVAEHLPESRAASFVFELCEIAPVVVFSAAVPYQTGAGHINCRWPSWWADLFAEHGYNADGAIRWDIWTDERIEPWYRQNLFVASRDVRRTEPLDVIHPTIHGWGR